jgi:hypothetical protein
MVPLPAAEEGLLSLNLYLAEAVASMAGRGRATPPVPYGEYKESEAHRPPYEHSKLHACEVKLLKLACGNDEAPDALFMGLGICVAWRSRSSSSTGYTFPLHAVPTATAMQG